MTTGTDPMTPYGCTFGDRQMCLIPNCPWPKCEDVKMSETQVLIDVALLERAIVLLRPYETTDSRVAAELAALIPTDPMAEAREVWNTACDSDSPVEVIHTALNADGRQGYVDGYYEIAAMLDIPAQTLSPREVFETQIKPRLAKLNAPRPMPACECLNIIDRRIETWRASGVNECLDEVPVLRSIRDAIVAATPQPRADLAKPLRELVSFVSVMVGRGPDCIIPEHINTPIGVPVKIGAFMRDAKAALAAQFQSARKGGV